MMRSCLKGLLAPAIAIGSALTAQAAEPSWLSGSWTQGALIVGRVAPGSAVWFDGAPLRVSPDGLIVFGLHRDAPAEVTLRIQDADGGDQTYRYAVTQRSYAIQRINGLPGAMVTPPDAVQQRIADDAARVAQARSGDRAATDFAQGFRWPVPGRVSSVYGSQRILNGEPKQPHYGIDIAAATGTPVSATAAGVVTLAETDLYYTGGTIIVDHGAGVTSTYLHLSKVLVAPGERVDAGQLIGKVGATGRVTGPHLCFRFNWGEARLDPQLLLPARDTK